MDGNMYCRNCGRVPKEMFDEKSKRRFWLCECTDGLLFNDKVIRGFTRQSRIDQLKAMHELMKLANDESIYFSWITYMPDEPSEEDFIDIAMNDELYNECFDVFVRLIKLKNNRY